MPKQAIQELYTDVDPHGAQAGTGKVFTDVTHPSAGFMLIGKGGVFSDIEVARLKLQGCPYLIDWNATDALAESEARNRATYGQSGGPGISLHKARLEAVEAVAARSLAAPTLAAPTPAAPTLSEKYGSAIAGLLEKGGFTTVEAVQAASDEDLLVLHGIAQAKLEQIRAA